MLQFIYLLDLEPKCMPSVHQFVPTAPKKKNKPSAQNFVWKKRGNFVPKIHDFDPSKVIYICV